MPFQDSAKHNDNSISHAGAWCLARTYGTIASNSNFDSDPALVETTSKKTKKEDEDSHTNYEVTGFIRPWKPELPSREELVRAKARIGSGADGSTGKVDTAGATIASKKTAPRAV